MDYNREKFKQVSFNQQQHIHMKNGSKIQRFLFSIKRNDLHNHSQTIPENTFLIDAGFCGFAFWIYIFFSSVYDV